MSKQLKSVTRLIAVVATVTSLVVMGAGGAAAQPDRATSAGTAQQAAKKRPVSIVVAGRVPIGAKVKITGTVHPAAPHQAVKLQLRSSGSWQTVRTKKLSARSRYKFKRTFATTGNWRFRVVVPRHGATHKVKSRARTIHVRTPGYDVSYPQCGATLPAGSFGLVGVDGGRPYDVNSCLATEIDWATTTGSPAYYVNTADPGPKKSTHWPKGQTSPQVCKATSLNSPRAPMTTAGTSQRTPMHERPLPQRRWAHPPSRARRGGSTSKPATPGRPWTTAGPRPITPTTPRR